MRISKITTVVILPFYYEVHCTWCEIPKIWPESPHIRTDAQPNLKLYAKHVSIKKLGRGDTLESDGTVEAGVMSGNPIDNTPTYLGAEGKQLPKMWRLINDTARNATDGANPLKVHWKNLKFITHGGGGKDNSWMYGVKPIHNGQELLFDYGDMISGQTPRVVKKLLLQFYYSCGPPIEERTDITTLAPP